jgi:hypothetical protein
MHKADINVTIDKDGSIETKLLIHVQSKPWYQGTKRMDYAHPLSRGIMGLYLFLNSRSGYLDFDITGRSAPLKDYDPKKYKNKVLLVYNRLLEKSEIELLIRTPVCMTQDLPKSPKHGWYGWCCCRTTHLNYCSCCGKKI